MTEPRAYRRPFWDTQPEYLFPHYLSTVKRAPSRPLVAIPQTLSEVTGPVFGYDEIGGSDHDLTRQHDGDPLGERMVVSGRVLDENGRSVRGALVEMWQANAAGRYRHAIDQHNAPLDPNFSGAGRVLTDEQGRYRFITIKPGLVSVAQSQQRVATGASALLAIRARARAAARHPDVFPRRSAARVRPDVQLHPGRQVASASRLHVRLGEHRSGVRARLPFRHRPAGARRDADGERPRPRRRRKMSTRVHA